MITFEISGDLEMFRGTARDFAKSEIRPKNREAEALGAVPEALAQQFVELGLAAVEVSEDFGGLGQGLVGRVVVDEALAHGDIGITLGMPTPGAFAQAVAALGSESQRSSLLSAMVEAGEKGAIAWSEHKPKPNTFSTVAVEQEDGSFKINGRKSEIVCGHLASAVVVFARTEYRNGDVRPGAFVVFTKGGSKAEGVRFSEPATSLGLQAAPVVSMTLEDVTLSASSRLDGADDVFETRVAELFLRIGLVGASRAVGLAAAAFDYARDYAEERKAFGKPIAHFQGLAFLIADMAIRVEVMRAMVHRAAWSFDNNSKKAPKFAAMAIAECHEGAMFVTNNAVQVLGGAGFIRDFPVEKWMRDAKSHMAYGMPYQLCDLLVGRLGLEGGSVTMEQDAPMPEIQPVLV